jgi:signal transduction histidine kinase
VKEDLVAEALKALPNESTGAKVYEWPGRSRRTAPSVDRREPAFGTDQDRLQLARDLHDVVGSAMTTINLQALVALEALECSPEHAAEALRTIAMSSSSSLSEVRALVRTLRQADSGRDTYSPRLTRLGGLVSAAVAGKLDVEVSVTGDVAGLPWTHDEAAYRIVQESVTNVLRHADASRVEITVVVRRDHLVLQVLDDGVGRSNDGAPGAQAGCGISGMRERAELLGGDLMARRGRRSGFRVRAWFPLPGSTDGGDPRDP